MQNGNSGLACPTISVIISTFNWSAALRCALTSVKLQTFTDFEVLVVGDGCTDDSEAAVAAFNDPRFKWHNLDRNFGAQWAPNNFGLAAASGEWVAYLGQDDIWHPDHLGSALRTAREQNADWVASVMICYGPPRSGVRALSGLFVDGVSGSTDFTPPSSVFHRKSLTDRIGFWKDPETLFLPSDCDFQNRAIEAGARIASTNELTAFKFNAAWRRDAYVLKPTSEQEELLAKIRAGDEFRHAELLEVLHAVVAAKFGTINMPSDAPNAAQLRGKDFKSNRRFKGAKEGSDSRQLVEIKARERFFLTDQFAPFEWHEEEHHPKFGSFRWSGPLPRASVDLPVRISSPLAVVVHVIRIIEPRLWETLKLSINESPVAFDTETTAEGTWLLSAVVAPSKHSQGDRGLRVSLEVDKPQRPRDLGINEDGRWLGIAVNWIEVAPA
jgi:glycosyltransferase involved in cell wall biosynthesis